MSLKSHIYIYIYVCIYMIFHVYTLHYTICITYYETQRKINNLQQLEKKKQNFYSPIYIFLENIKCKYIFNILAHLTSCTSIVFSQSLNIHVNFLDKKINLILSEIRWKVARLKYSSWLPISSTKITIWHQNVYRSLGRLTVIMSWCAYCEGSSILSCPFTCFVQEQLLVSSCFLFPTRRLKGEALSREVMLQCRTSKNKWIQWGNIKFIGQMSSRQLVLIYRC